MSFSSIDPCRLLPHLPLPPPPSLRDYSFNISPLDDSSLLLDRSIAVCCLVMSLILVIGLLYEKFFHPHAVSPFPRLSAPPMFSTMNNRELVPLSLSNSSDLNLRPTSTSSSSFHHLTTWSRAFPAFPIHSIALPPISPWSTSLPASGRSELIDGLFSSNFERLKQWNFEMQRFEPPCWSLSTTEDRAWRVYQCILVLRRQSSANRTVSFKKFLLICGV